MISRHSTPTFVVLAAAAATGVALFVLVGGRAGALYAAAALTLGLIVQQRLAAGRPADEAPEAPTAERPARERRFGLPRGRRAALEAELARVGATLSKREEQAVELASKLEAQHERMRQLQSSFAERIAQAAGELQSGKAELAEVQTVLAQREAVVAELIRERDAHGARAAQLSNELTELRKAREAERARLTWAWRTHVEELAALEAAVDGILRD